MMGNSHTSQLPSILEKIFAAGQPDKTAAFTLAPGNMYLIDRMNNNENLTLLKQKNWTHLVLQALKYSSSMSNNYATTGAEYFINQSNDIGAVPVLYPEHPREGNTWEAQYLFELHSYVAAKTSACVAPTGFIWEEVMVRNAVDLYANDGNHASASGYFLTSLIFYQIITGEAADTLPFIDAVGVDVTTQEVMRDVVSDILGIYEPCL